MQDAGKSWWDFYAVRYAMASVVGALLIYGLLQSSATTMEILFIPEYGKDLGVAHLLLWGVLGLAYCYVASLPILVAHAARFVILNSAAWKWKMSAGSGALGLVIVFWHLP